MIRIFTLGIVCLTGIGGVAAVKNLPSRTPADEVVADVAYPVAVGTRADRLPVSVETSPAVNESEPAAPTAELAITQPLPPSVDLASTQHPPPSADLAGTQPLHEQKQPPQIEDKPSIRKSMSPPQQSRSAQRFKARQHALSSRAQARAPAAAQVEAAKICSSDGWDNLLRKLDLKPAC
jgi:hypothetical protein